MKTFLQIAQNIETGHAGVIEIVVIIAVVALLFWGAMKLPETNKK